MELLYFFAYLKLVSVSSEKIFLQYLSATVLFAIKMNDISICRLLKEEGFYMRFATVIGAITLGLIMMHEAISVCMCLKGKYSDLQVSTVLDLVSFCKQALSSYQKLE